MKFQFQGLTEASVANEETMIKKFETQNFEVMENGKIFLA